MRNILFCGYREWSKEIFKRLDSYTKKVVNLIHITKGDDLKKSVDEHSPEFIFFVGWSWIIDKDIIENYNCICLHPSPVPKYRGGSPIQHQIMNGETKSAVTLFKMDEGIDTGDILYQIGINLNGELKDIFDRIIAVGVVGIKNILDRKYTQIKQDDKESTFYRRKTPNMSEIKIEDFEKYTSEQIHNKIRALQNPYPNAFIKCKDGTNLFLTKSKIGEK